MCWQLFFGMWDLHLVPFKFGAKCNPSGNWSTWKILTEAKSGACSCQSADWQSLQTPLPLTKLFYFTQHGQRKHKGKHIPFCFLYTSFAHTVWNKIMWGKEAEAGCHQSAAACLQRNMLHLMPQVIDRWVALLLCQNGPQIQFPIPGVGDEIPFESVCVKNYLRHT